MTTTTALLFSSIRLIFFLNKEPRLDFFSPQQILLLINSRKQTRAQNATHAREREKESESERGVLCVESEREYFCGCRCCSRISKHEQPPRGRCWGNATDEEHIFHQARVRTNEAGSPKSLTPSLGGDMGDRVFSRDAENRFRRRLLRCYEYQWIDGLLCLQRKVHRLEKRK